MNKIDIVSTRVEIINCDGPLNRTVVSGRVDRESAHETVDSASIPGRVKLKD